MVEPQKPQFASPRPRPAIRLEYTCPARPPEYIDMKALTVFGRDEKGFYWESLGKKYHADIEFIKMLFTPKSMTWEETIRIVK